MNDLIIERRVLDHDYLKLNEMYVLQMLINYELTNAGPTGYTHLSVEQRAKYERFLKVHVMTMRRMIWNLHSLGLIKTMIIGSNSFYYKTTL